MKCLVIISSLISVCYGGLSGSYLPGTTTGVVFGGSGLGLGGGSGSYYRGSETSIFPVISNDPRAFEHGDSSVVQGGATNEVYYYGGHSHGDKTRLRILLNSAGRKTNVIFVKSPESGSVVVPEVIAPQSASEERTSVFVLSKKPEALGSITIPAGLSNKIVKTKPEVYYLKYNNVQDAERAVAQSLSGGRAVGTGVQTLNKDSFVRTLVDDGYGSAVSGSSISGGILGFGGAGRTLTSDLGSGATLVGGSGDHGGLFSAESSGSRYGVPGASGPY
ncbi:hypothetical protein FQR65_LT02033 [Abscondita terminalis]|nr:hypothetical protein FQR65_LT02033 [Abscondita terminalis]